MNYIVIDLEWNQSSVPGGENSKLPFEIIEIGATKLDEHFKIIDQYGSIVKPRVYRRLQSRIREILNYDETVLWAGRPFDVVFREFKKWCGEDYIFCTWGPLDVTYLQQNMDFYYLKHLDFPVRFYNLQEIYAINHYNDKLQMPSLEKAVTELKINIDEPFHSAKNDAYYTAVVFQKMSRKHLSDLYSIDYYQHPTSVENEITSKHQFYSEYISRPFNNRMEALEDKDIISMRCYKCNRKLSKKIRWFVNNSSTHICVGKCWNHGLVCSKIRFKNTPDNNIFVIKTSEKISKKELLKIKERQNALQKKRREKRHQKKIKD